MNDALQKAFEAVRKLEKWVPTPEHIAEIKAGGRSTCAAVWDNLRPDIRKEFRPDLNPDKRWFQQRPFDKISKIV